MSRIPNFCLKFSLFFEKITSFFLENYVACSIKMLVTKHYFPLKTEYTGLCAPIVALGICHKQIFITGFDGYITKTIIIDELRNILK